MCTFQIQQVSHLHLRRDGARAKFSTYSHEADNSGKSVLVAVVSVRAGYNVWQCRHFHHDLEFLIRVNTTKYIYTQSTTVYIPSLELGPPHPFSRKQVCSSPRNKRGVTHSPAGEGVGDPIPTTGETAQDSIYLVVNTNFKEIEKSEKLAAPCLSVWAFLIHSATESRNGNAF